MLKQILEALGQLFSALFPAPTTPKDPEELPTNEDTSDMELSDYSDLPRDTIIVTEELPPRLEPLVVTPIEDRPPKEKEQIPVVEEDKPDDPIPTRKPKFMWCLDNGHAKETAGKRSPQFELDGIPVQFFEYEFNRDVVRRIIAAMKEQHIEFFNVVPEEENDVRLRERVRRANTLQTSLPKIYVSVHANAGPSSPSDPGWTPASGIETWYFHGSRKGRAVASVFQKHLIESLGWRNRKLRTTQQRMLYVLKHTHMPAILTENGFFNNRREVELLMRDEVRQAVADAHITAILEIEDKGWDGILG